MPKTGIALIAPEDASYEPWSAQFNGDGMGYMKYQTNPARYLAEQKGETYTTVDPSQQIEYAPLTSEQWMRHATGDTNVLPAASARQEQERLGALQALGVTEAPIIRMTSTPGIIEVERSTETPFDRMSHKERKRANRQLNRDERRLNRDMRRDSRIEQAIIKKFGSDYNPGNRIAMDEKFQNERERIDLMRNLLNR